MAKLLSTLAPAAVVVVVCLSLVTTPVSSQEFPNFPAPACTKEGQFGFYTPRVRTYYVKAEMVEWDYLPFEKDLLLNVDSETGTTIAPSATTIASATTTEPLLSTGGTVSSSPDDEEGSAHSEEHTESDDDDAEDGQSPALREGAEVFVENVNSEDQCLIGSKYRKALFIQYTDATFTTRVGEVDQQTRRLLLEAGAGLKHTNNKARASTAGKKRRKNRRRKLKATARFALRRELQEEEPPVEGSPDDEAPVEGSPDDETPVDNSPDDEIPVEGSPDDETPAESSPDDETSVDAGGDDSHPEEGEEEEEEEEEESYLTLGNVTLESSHLGFQGPVIRAVVGDEVHFVLHNALEIPVSAHPHGLHYDMASEGVAREEGVEGGVVQPGETVTYVWHADEASGPGPADGSSINWAYHSHVDAVPDTYSGLAGPIVVTAADCADWDTAQPLDVDKEFVLLFSVTDENAGHFLEKNVRAYCPLLDTDSPDELYEDDEFVESNLMHGINGYLYGNIPGVIADLNDKTRWYLWSLGTEVDLHTAHWHGVTGIADGHRVDTVELLPASFKVTDIVADNQGVWQFHCHVNDHISAGMTGLFRIRDPAQQEEQQQQQEHAQVPPVIDGAHA